MNEQFINDIGAENFSKEDRTFSIEDFKITDFEKYFNKESELKNPNNIYINYTIPQKKIGKEMYKTIKLKRFINNKKSETVRINFKIPFYIQNEQSIILYGEGHHKNGITGNLIIKILSPKIKKPFQRKDYYVKE